MMKSPALLRGFLFEDAANAAALFKELYYIS